jgi:hypothetical protein
METPYIIMGTAINLLKGAIATSIALSRPEGGGSVAAVLRSI